MRTRLCQSSTSALTLARDWLVEFNAEAGWVARAIRSKLRIGGDLPLA